MTTFGMPSDLTPEEHFAAASRSARQVLAEREAGREVPEKQLQQCRRIVAEWGKYEATDGTADE